MKRLISIFLFIGLTLFLLNCSENNLVTPNLDEVDQAEATLAKEKAKFSGICTPVSLTPINTWYDAADDIRVTGKTVWIEEYRNPVDDITIELGGTAELTADNGVGKWEMVWKGSMTFTSPDGSTFRIVAHAVGTGSEGDVIGLTAKWKYTMNYDGTDESFHYLIKGQISE